MPNYTKTPSEKDNFLLHANSDNNQGDTTYLALNGHTITLEYRIILYFDISDFPKTQGTIEKATLKLYYYEYINSNPDGEKVWAYKLTKDNWVELESTWDRYADAGAWTAAGGDYVTSGPTGGSVLMPANPVQWVEWDVTNIVKDAILTVSNHVNILVKYDNEGQRYAKTPKFYSNDETVHTTKRPTLEIKYSGGGMMGSNF